MMRRFAAVALLTVAIFAGGREQALAQGPPPPTNPVYMPAGSSAAITPLAGYAMGAIAVGAVAPMVATAVLGRELTLSEVWHLELGIFLGPHSP